VKPEELLDLIRREAQGGASADDVARAVEAILRRLKRGQSVSLPGVGKLVPEGKRSVRFEQAAKPGARRGRG
jgi:nucleoid DNA-binding protein